VAQQHLSRGSVGSDGRSPTLDDSHGGASKTSHRTPADDARRLIRILVLADHLVARVGVQMLLAHVLDLDFIGDGTSRKDVLALLSACRPDLVIFDPDPDLEIDPVHELARMAPWAKFLVLTGIDTPERHESARRSGAQGLVLKCAPIEELVTAIRCVQGGEIWFRRRVTARGSHAPVRSEHLRQRRRMATLTGRECEIVTLIAEGLRNEQIAARMGVAEKTVRNHLSTVFDKLGVNDRLGLAVYLYQHGLARPPHSI
jgi:DNA-binding NarL/FixJ family response regulator